MGSIVMGQVTFSRDWTLAPKRNLPTDKTDYFQMATNKLELPDKYVNCPELLVRLFELVSRWIKFGIDALLVTKQESSVSQPLDFNPK